MFYTDTVYIIPLSGRHQKREPLRPKGSKKFSFSLLCNFLYIVDLLVFMISMNEERMSKKTTFYTSFPFITGSSQGKLRK